MRRRRGGEPDEAMSLGQGRNGASPAAGGVGRRAERLALGLSGELWVVQLGIFLNYLGWGAVLPFELIYLHEGRGFSLRVAGLVLGTVTGLAVVAAPAVGPVIDRVGARWTAAGAGMALAVGYAGLAFARTPTQAFIAAAVAGAGNGGLLPSQSALVAQLAEGRRRALAMAVAAAAFVAACLLVVGAGLIAPVLAFATLLTAAVIVGVGECFHTTALMPLVADLAPPALRGRYMAAMGLSWWLGLAAAPILGTQLLSVSPRATMLAAGGVALAAAVSALALERDLPPETRLTPRPAGPRQPRRRLAAWFAQPGPLVSPRGGRAVADRPRSR